jgi:hypothetical protein
MEFCFWGPLLRFRSFLFSRWRQGQYFNGLPRLFVGVRLLELPFGLLDYMFLFQRWRQGERFVELVR